MPPLRLLSHMVRITKFKYFFKGSTRMKHRIAEGVRFLTAFIKGISGFLRPTFCTTRASVSFAPALKGSRIRPPACLDCTSFFSDLWDISSSEFTGEVYNLAAPAADQVPCWLLASPQPGWQKRTGVHDLMGLKLPMKVLQGHCAARDQ